MVNDLLLPILVLVLVEVFLIVFLYTLWYNKRRQNNMEEKERKIKIEVMYKLTIIGRPVNDTEAKEVPYNIFVPRELLSDLYSEIGMLLEY